jgi:hypothetical protein
VTLLLLAVSCHPSADFPSKYKGKQIEFGQGGGFSGAVTQFVLLDDGRLFQRPWKDSSVVFVQQWKRNLTSQLFLNYISLNLQDLSYNEPGDLYYFIDYHPDALSHHRIVWGKPGFHPDDNLITYYNLLFRSSKPKS